MVEIQWILTNISSIISSNLLLIIISFVLASTKINILRILFSKKFNSTQLKVPFCLLVMVLTFSLIIDVEWFFTFSKKLFFGNQSIHFFTFLTRVAWASYIAFYQSLILFLESLVDPSCLSRLRNKIFSSISFILSIMSLLFALVHYNRLTVAEKHWSEMALHRTICTYALLPLMISGIIIILLKLKTLKIPKILAGQLNLLMCWIIIPMWVSDFITLSSFILMFSRYNINMLFAGISNTLITTAFFYCSRKMLGLRFLNWHSHVQSPVDIHFMEKFTPVIDQFSRVSSIHELTHITHQFFKELFAIPIHKVILHIRSENYSPNEQTKFAIETVENHLHQFPKEMRHFIKQQRILVYDELEFSNFYEPSQESGNILTFLNDLNADIFLPMYEKDTLIAYIVINRFARPKQFYSKTEYDEMLVYSQYLGNIIHLMQSKKVDALAKQIELLTNQLSNQSKNTKNLHEKLYLKHQENNQYRESIRSFLRTNTDKKIGTLFYKNRQFTFGNKSATELLQINPNQQEGHPLTKALKQLAYHVEAYRSPHTLYAKDAQGAKLILSGMPSLENSGIIINIYYPELTDIVKKQIDLLKDPSEWDYLLYLETTQSGQLINQLIPGTGETLLNFKIELLKTALSKKATLLTMHEQDLAQVVQLLHKISIRETLKMIELTEPAHGHEIAMHLFGMNRIFTGDSENNIKEPLLKQLDGIGTLFIKNIQYLTREAQEYLAEFIRYGYFRTFKGEEKTVSNVRIICSTQQNLHELVQQGKFSPELFNELKETTLAMPAMTDLTEHELITLSQGYSEQALPNEAYKNLLSLSDRDKLRLAQQRPVSLFALKERVQQLLVEKSKKSNIDQEIFDPALGINDPELIDAARLGKEALKDERVMSLLWNKFKSQNKIATFLGVNRSTINRRCKQYNLGE